VSRFHRILLKASLKEGWLDELKKWLKKDDYNDRYSNIKFIHYDSPNAAKRLNSNFPVLELVSNLWKVCI